MNITKIYVAKSNGGVSVGYGSITFEEAITIRFSIMKSGKDGRLFVNWPSKKGTDNKWYPDVSFVVNENDEENKYAIKNSIDSEILKEFNKVVGINTTSDTPKSDTSFTYGDNSAADPAEPATKPKREPLVKFGNKK